jgi:predicted acyltransferase (DUF342 family)
VPNRKITQFPAITASEIRDADLLTTVSVFEVDPALRNKRITFTEFRSYLDQYYINSLNFDPLIATNIIISSGLNTSGVVSFSDTLSVTGVATLLDNVNISGDTVLAGDLDVGGTFNGDVVDVGTLITDSLEVQGTGTFVTATGGQGNFATGNFQQTYTHTATGQNSNYVNGNFSVLTADVSTIGTLDISGITITGDFTSSGTITANDLNVTGTLSGATITGDTVNVETLNTESGYFQYVSGETITGETVEIFSGVVANLDAEIVTLNQVRATGLYADNLTGLVTTVVTGFVQEDFSVSGTLSGTYITGETLNAVSAYVDTFTGAFVSGFTINSSLINVDVLNAASLSFSGDQIISGELGVLQNINTPSGVRADSVVGSGTVSGAVISGISGVFQDHISVTTIDATTGVFESVIVSGESSLSGLVNIGDDTIISGDLTVTGDLYTGENTIISGTLVVTGETTLQSGLSVVDDVYLGSGLVVSGDTAISGDVTIHGDLSVSGNFQISGGDIIVDDLQVVDDAWIGDRLSVSGNTTISGTTLISGATVIENNLFITSGLTVTGDILGEALISGDRLFVDSSVTAVTVTGTSGVFTEVTGQQGDFVSGSYDDLDVIDTLRVPFGDLTSPGVSFIDFGSSNTVYDGILISSPDLTNNHVMTFVNQNTSGMSLTSGVNGFVLTIWGA